MGKFLNSIFGPKEQDVIYIPVKEVKQKDSKKEETPNEKLEETIKSVNAPKKAEDITKKEEKEEKKEAENTDGKTEIKQQEKKPYFFKETVYKTLTILLIEDSKDTYMLNKEIVELSKRATGDNLAVIIHYGKNIEDSGLLFPGQVDEDELICINEKGTSLCLYDAIIHIETIVTGCIYHSFEDKTKRYEIENIEIVGFSTGVDNASIYKKEEAYNAFKKISNRTKVTNKCFCITEDNFISLASIGFHSIGRIKTNF